MTDFLLTFLGAFGGAACGLLAAAQINSSPGRKRRQELSALVAKRDRAIFAATDAATNAILSGGSDREALEQLLLRRMDREAAVTAYETAFTAEDQR